MKKAFIAVLFIFGYLFLSIPSVHAAGGTCACSVGYTRTCGLLTNSCDSGYTPTCVSDITKCNTTATSCSCVGSGKTATPTTNIGASAAIKVCDAVSEADKASCTTCMDGEHVWTAIGCVSTDPNKLVNTILPFGIGIAGGIAFLLILFGALQIMTSAGNPEKLNAGRELVSAAITGLLLIIFSVFILQLIGFQILHIPGFG